MNIWAVSAFFNFSGSNSRLKNYKIFRQNLKDHDVKLLTVEFSPSGHFQLEEDDADKLIRMSDGDIMWQKERLINLGIDKLPQDTDIVLILDTDIVFSSGLVLDLIQKELKNNKAVHCLSSVVHLNPFTVDYEEVNYYGIDIDNDKEMFFSDPLSSCVAAHQIVGNFQYGCCGYAWAFNYETIKDIKLFEYNIIGGGDKISASAFIGLPFPPGTIAGKNGWPYISYYEKVKKAGLNKNNVTYIDMPIFDLFHGFHFNRQYNERHFILKEAGFDIDKDLIDRPGLPFKFAESVSEETRQKVANYFKERADF
jgi:hypothetical protein